MKERLKKLAGIFLTAAAVLTLAAPAGQAKAAGTASIGEPAAAVREESTAERTLEAEPKAAAPSVYETMAAGTIVEEDGYWYYYEDGVWISDKYDIVDFDGSKFLIANGVVARHVSGLCEYGGIWYFLSAGQVQTQYTGLAQYDGEWFYIENGILASNVNGIKSYDSGLFLISDGHIRYDYSGLFLNTDGAWYFLANGQVQAQYTGLAQYDNAWFYINYGLLDTSYTGYVKYDGSVFYVQNGQMTNDAYYMGLYARAVSNRSLYGSDIAGVYSYVNQYRSEAGSAGVVLDEDICIAACIRAQEMVDSGIFGHTRPNGEKCFTILDELAIPNMIAGENIAYGYRNAAEVCTGWYNSAGHYNNMVDTDFKKIGIGVAVDEKNGRKYWVQLFTD